VSCDGVSAPLKNAITFNAADGAVAAANDVPPSVTNSAIIRMEQTFFHEVIKHLLVTIGKKCCMEPAWLAGWSLRHPCQVRQMLRNQFVNGRARIVDMSQIVAARQRASRSARQSLESAG
jgi:hypothetical protein